MPIPDAERQYPEMRRKTEEAAWKALDGVMRPEQMKRFKQIVFQRRRSAVFFDPEVQRQLSLTDEQKAWATKFEEERKKKSNQDGVGADGLAKLEAEQIRKTVDVLTDEQKKVWDDLTGEAFEVKPGLPAPLPEGRKSEVDARPERSVGPPPPARNDLG